MLSSHTTWCCIAVTIDMVEIMHHVSSYKVKSVKEGNMTMNRPALILDYWQIFCE